MPSKDIITSAPLLGEPGAAMALAARGTSRQSKDVDSTLAFINPMPALGKAGKPRCGCITGQGNEPGGRGYELLRMFTRHRGKFFARDRLWPV